MEIKNTVYHLINQTIKNRNGDVIELTLPEVIEFLYHVVRMGEIDELEWFTRPRHDSPPADENMYEAVDKEQLKEFLNLETRMRGLKDEDIYTRLLPIMFTEKIKEKLTKSWGNYLTTDPVKNRVWVYKGGVVIVINNGPEANIY